MVRELWYAVNGNGRWNVFTNQPTRDEHFKIWKGEMASCYDETICSFECDGFELPQTSWKDEPVKMELKLDCR